MMNQLKKEKNKNKATQHVGKSISIFEKEENNSRAYHFNYVKTN